jgi:hypothetical protein
LNDLRVAVVDVIDVADFADVAVAAAVAAAAVAESRKEIFYLVRCEPPLLSNIQWQASELTLSVEFPSNLRSGWLLPCLQMLD